jgi:hypothetical protein
MIFGRKKSTSWVLKMGEKKPPCWAVALGVSEFNF